MTKEVKLLEIRDKKTFIPAMAIQVSGEDGYLMRRAGFNEPMVYLIRLTYQMARYDPHSWEDNHTMRTAHKYMYEHWDEVSDGDVIDVEFIRGESSTKKVSEEISLRKDPASW